MISLDNVTFSYQKDDPTDVILSNISFEIKKGEFVGIIGHTGSGKSTLMQIVSGLLSPVSGRVVVLGKNLTASKVPAAQIRGKVGLVFQYPEHQLFAETVFDDIAFAPKNNGLSEAEVKDRVKEAMEMTGIDPSLSNCSPFDLSGGQKRRVAIAGVLAMHPEILILDEPAAGLDPAGRKEVFESILSFREKYGTTVLFVSHSMEEVAAFAERVMVLHQGKLFMDGTPQEIYHHSLQLEEIGLAVPEINRVIRLLKEKGLPVSEDILTLNDAICALSLLLGGDRP